MEPTGCVRWRSLLVLRAVIVAFALPLAFCANVSAKEQTVAFTSTPPSNAAGGENYKFYASSSEDYESK